MTRIKTYFIGAQMENNGEVGYYINMNIDFIAPIMDKKISIFRGQSVKISDVVGTFQTFDYGALGAVIHQIEKHITKRGSS